MNKKNNRSYLECPKDYQKDYGKLIRQGFLGVMLTAVTVFGLLFILTGLS